MSNDFDMSQYKDLFLQEADEQIEILEAETLKLESEPTSERLQIIFRAAHTIKGSSRAMGYENFAALTHELENILDQVRNHTLDLTSEIIDALLSSIDALQEMKSSIGDHGRDSIDFEIQSSIIECLQSFSSSKSISLVNSSTKKSLDLAEDGEQNQMDYALDASKIINILPEEEQKLLRATAEYARIYYARVRLDKECCMKYPRAFMSFNVIKENGKILATIPEGSDLEEERFESEFSVFFESEDQLEALRVHILNIVDIEDVKIYQWKPEEEILELLLGGNEPLSDHAFSGTREAIETESKNFTANRIKEDQAAKAVKDAKTNMKDFGQTVRVDVARLDSLMNLIGELVIDRTRISQIGAELSQKFHDPNIEALSETVDHVARTTTDLQEQIMKARMMPIEMVFNRFPRVVRDLANKLNKEVELEMVGGETELDRSVIEIIGDPILHIIRNSLDHGLESAIDRKRLGKPEKGKLRIAARHQENYIVIDIVDDGRGIDIERIKEKAISTEQISRENAERLSDKDALQLMFLSGVSTAKEVSEVSGRGVGMDIVKSNIQTLGGLIDVDTELGKGTRFSLRLPLTLAIIRGLLVCIGKGVYVIPLGSVIETLLIHKKDVQEVNQREVVVLRGVTTPLIKMSSIFGKGKQSVQDQDTNFAVIVGIGDQRVGLIVDKLIGEQEVVIKSLSSYLGDVRGISGATILGDGNVALIVDVNEAITRECVA